MEEHAIDAEVEKIVKRSSNLGVSLGYLHALGAQVTSTTVNDVARSINRLVAAGVCKFVDSTRVVYVKQETSDAD